MLTLPHILPFDFLNYFSYLLKSVSAEIQGLGVVSESPLYW